MPKKSLTRLVQKGKTCTPRGGKPSHPSSHISLVNCKKCHAAKCFFHILQGSVHASEALLANTMESGSAAWHKRHQEARERNVLPLASLPLVHKLDTLDRRVFFAWHFSSTSPFEAGMCTGFYDVPLQDPPSVSFRRYTWHRPASEWDVSLQQTHLPIMRKPHSQTFLQYHSLLR